MNASIIEFYTLTYANRAATEYHYPLFFAVFDEFLRLVLARGHRVKIRGFCAELAGAGVYHFVYPRGIIDFAFGNIFKTVEEPRVHFGNLVQLVYRKAAKQRFI